MSDNSFAGINFNDPESKDIFQNNAKNMCPRYKTSNESGFVLDLNVKSNNDNTYVIYGNLDAPFYTKKIYVKYSACNPPTYNTSFAGSGLPFPNEDVAFDNTPNRGVVEITNGYFSFSIKYPNSYYINMGTVYVAPHVKILLVNQNNEILGEVKTVNLGEGIPYRTLTWPNQRDWSDGPLFYKTNIDDLPVRTQYQILLDSAYPSTNNMPSNFWGTKPPN